MFIKTSVFFFRQGTEGNDTGLLRKILQVLEQAKYLRKENCEPSATRPKTWKRNMNQSFLVGNSGGCLSHPLNTGHIWAFPKKYWYPKMDSFWGKTLLKLMMWGYPYFFGNTHMKLHGNISSPPITMHPFPVTPSGHTWTDRLGPAPICTSPKVDFIRVSSSQQVSPWFGPH